MKNGIILSAIVFTLSLTACSNYLEEFEDEYRDSAYAKTDIFSPTESSASIIDAGDSSGTSSKDASSSDARAEGQSSGKTDEEFDCDMNDSACISEIANEFGKTVRLFDSRNNNVYTAIYVGGLDYETANGYGSIFDDSVSFLLMTENLEYEGESVTALDTNGVFFYTYENAEKACPTGWRLPKITPEWFFLLTGEGHQFNIELPDDEKGCYIDGKFDSGKSIFYWAQKEGETSWFVKKSYLANDYDLHEQERCNTFPVRCVKEFGRHADYAGSSSSSGEAKSSSSEGGSSSSVAANSSSSSSNVKPQSSSSSNISSSSGLQNCEAFKKDGGNLIYSLNNENYGFTKGVSIYNVTSGSHLELNEDSEFCIEFTDNTNSDVQFTFGFMYSDTSVYFTSSIEKNSLAAEFEVGKASCQMNDSVTNAFRIECGENAKGNALKNINYFYCDVNNISIKNIYVKNAEIKENSSSSSEPATTCPDVDGDWHTLYDSGDEDDGMIVNINSGESGYEGYSFNGAEIKDFSEVNSICIEYEYVNGVREGNVDTVRIGYNEQTNNDWSLKYVYWLPLPTGQSSTTVSLSDDVCNGGNSQDGCSDNNINFIDLPDSSKKHVFVQKIMYKGVIKKSEPANACPDVDGDWKTLYDNNGLSISGGYCAYGSCNGSDGSYDGYTLGNFYDFSGVESICIEYENTAKGEEPKSQLGVHLGHRPNDNSGHGYQYVVPIIDDQNFYKVEFSEDLCDTNFLDGKCTFNISVIEFPNPIENSVTVTKVMYKGNGSLKKGQDPYENDQQN